MQSYSRVAAALFVTTDVLTILQRRVASALLDTDIESADATRLRKDELVHRLQMVTVLMHLIQSFPLTPMRPLSSPKIER